MFYTLLFIHILLCVVLIALVLMQQGKGADMGAAFGGNSSSLFGAGGATDFVTKLTTSLAIAFMVTSILLVRVYTSYSHAGMGTSNPLEGSVLKPEVIAPPVPEVVVAPETAPAKDAAAAKEAAPAVEAPKAEPAAEVKKEAAPEVAPKAEAPKADAPKKAETKKESKKK